MPRHVDGVAGRPDIDADEGDHGGLARGVWAEQRENLALLNLQVDALERLKTRSIAFGQAGNGDDGCHARHCPLLLKRKDRAPSAPRNRPPGRVDKFKPRRTEIWMVSGHPPSRKREGNVFGWPFPGISR